MNLISTIFKKWTATTVLLLMFGITFSQSYMVINSGNAAVDGLYTYFGSNMFNYPVYMDADGYYLHNDGTCWIIGQDANDPYNLYLYYNDCTGSDPQFSTYWNDQTDTQVPGMYVQLVDKPELTASASPVCIGGTATLTANGILAQGTDWYWYSGTCGTTLIGTGASITVTPSTSTLYYCRAEDSFSFTGFCESIYVAVASNNISLSYAEYPEVCTTPKTITYMELEMLTHETYGNDCSPSNTTDGTFTFSINGNSSGIFTTSFDGSSCGILETFDVTALSPFVLDGSNLFAFDLDPSGTSGFEAGGWTKLHISYSDGTMESIQLFGDPSEYGDACTGNIYSIYYGMGYCGTQGQYPSVNANVQLTQPGHIDLMVNGGLAPYSFDWDNDGTGDNDDPMNLVAGVGTYMVSVSDVCGTTASLSNLQITNVTGPELALLSSTDPSCPGSSDGNIDVKIAQTCGLFTITWTGNGGPYSTEDLTGLTAGTYDLTVTDENGTSTLSVTLTDPAPAALTYTETVVPVICSTPRTVTAMTLTMLTYESYGDYSTNNCSSIVTDGTFTLSVNGNVSAVATASYNNSCGLIETFNMDALGAFVIHGNNDFELDLQPNGTGGLEYASYAYLDIVYSDGNTEQVQIVGNSSENGTDWCTGSPGEYGGMTTCLGSSQFLASTNEIELEFKGGVLLDVTGGIAPYSYDWDNDGTGDFDDENPIYPLDAGTYSVVIMDACGATTNGTFVIDPATGPVVFQPNTVITQPTCPGSSNGSIEIEIAGSCGAPTFIWEDDSNPGSTIASTKDLMNVAAGNYTLYASNDNGTSTYNFTIVDPISTPLGSSIAATDITCGATMLTVTSLEFEWLGTDCSGSETISFYVNGQLAYNGTNDGAASCDCDPGTTQNTIVTNPTVLNAVINGNNQFDIDFTNVTIAISYATVTIHLSDGSSQTIEVLSPQSGNIGSFGTNICDYGYYTSNINQVFANVDLFFGAASVDLTVSGGTAPYTFSWDNPQLSTTEDIYVIDAASYTVEITDACGQTQQNTIAVVVDDQIDPDMPTLLPQTGECSVSVPVPTTTDNCAGTITGTTSDPLTYSTLGSYTVNWTFDDGNGNSIVVPQTVVVNDVTAPIFAGMPTSINVNATSTSCAGTATWTAPTASDNCNGAVTITSSHNSGDVFPFGTTTVTYTATDGVGNQSSSTFTVTVDTDMAVAGIAPTDATCNASNDGSIDLSITGGNSVYSYDWTGPNGFTSTTEDPSGLEPGNYSVVVTDGNGCETSGTITVAEPTAVAVSVDASSDPTICGTADGTASITATGGTVASSYTYSWSNTSGYTSTNEDPTDLPVGVNTVLVTDDNGCTASDFVILVDPNSPSITLNTTSSVMTVPCNGDMTGDIQVDVVLGGSATSATYQWDDMNSSTTEDLTGLGAGTYTLEVIDDNGCASFAQFAVTEPNAISVVGFPVDLLCNGDQSGAIDIEANGGVVSAGYTYSWTDGGTYTSIDEDITGLSAGTYTVTVVDDNDCSISDSFTITEPTAVTIASSSIDEINGNDGSIDMTVTGGVPTYTYAWDGPNSFTATTEDLTGLAGGQYDVVVTDANGCIANSSVTVLSQVGINDVALISATIYPNPTSGLINIQTNYMNFEYIKVYDELGKVVMNISLLEDYQLTIDIKDLERGIYFLVLGNETISKTFKVTLQD